jgi:hypothetical protein
MIDGEAVVFRSTEIHQRHAVFASVQSSEERLRGLEPRCKRHISALLICNHMTRLTWPIGARISNYPSTHTSRSSRGSSMFSAGLDSKTAIDVRDEAIPLVEHHSLDYCIVLDARRDDLLALTAESPRSDGRPV